MNKIKDERGDIITDYMEMKKEWLYANKLDNLDEVDKFLK